MKKHLNIAMYFASHPGRAGGVQEHVLYLTKELENLGHHVTIFGSAVTDRFPHYQQIGNIIQSPMPNGNWVSITVSMVGEKKPSEVINNGQFDICHIHEPYTPFITWELINHLTIPKVVTFHGAWDDGSFAGIPDTILPIMKNYFSPKVAGAIYISETVRKKWKTLCSKKVYQQVIFYGIDHKIYHPQKTRNKGVINLLFLARLVSKKGLLYLLKALSSLLGEFPKIQLTVVGDGEMRAKFESFVYLHNLTKNVSFVGEVVGKEKIPYFQAADIFCAPYKDEGFGLTVLEAMSCGCPIVGFRNEAFSEWLATYPGKKFLVKKQDVAGLARVLKKLISDHALRKRLGSWCYEKSNYFNWEKVGAETEQFYYQALTRQSFG